MKLLLLALATGSAAFLFSYTLIAQNPATANVTSGRCSISGIVVKLGGSEPVRKARIRLQSVDDKSRVVVALTDSDGKFVVKGVEAGRYRLTVSRLGFVAQEYGQKKSDGPGAVLSLRPDQEIRDLIFRLVPSAVLTGHVLDEDGDPQSGIWVDALRQVYAEGKRTLLAVDRAETNDLGEYRLFGLSAGRYFVSAVSPRADGSVAEQTLGSPAEQKGYGKIYYPGTPDPSEAIGIDLKPGDEIPAMDIMLRPVLLYRVRGRVFNEVSSKSSTGTNLFLVPRSRPGAEQWEFMDQQVSVEKPDGSFEIGGVLPGSYSLVAFWMDGGKFYTTRMPVDVGNGDVEGLSVKMAVATTVPGDVVWQGGATSNTEELNLSCESVEVNFGAPQRAHVARDGTFAFKDLGEGLYRVRVSGLCKDCYVKEVRYSHSMVSDNVFRVLPGQTGSLELTVSMRGARIKGSVVDGDGLPAPGVWVVLIPDASRRTQFSLYAAQSTDQRGNFDFRGIPPGEYKLFSWDNVELNAWQDQQFLRSFEGRGESVTAEEGDLKTVNLVVINTNVPTVKTPQL